MTLKKYPMRLFSWLLTPVLFLPTPAFSHALDQEMACEGTPHEFVEELLNLQSIETPASRVQQDSVNAFRPTRGAHLTAFGFRVKAIFGYQPDDPLFEAGTGKPASAPIYGVVVFGSSESVQRELAAAGSRAITHSVIPMVLTAIVCAQ
ncbi:hypothetical protein [Paraburkholderia kirstenboschensis]|uniref:Uncharacterized protein n=1 Tax=Paraburkholderia kirstenboschensis TaxID=1245436 RepID=A0ABZ0ECS1_9BURK|nr:hypothetical protein [Paraburkholderia kirstenboschensis]WOD15034.1 hypothetical protein RW095_17005 [Paraburkholderia kirstenboschensis]